MKHSKIFYTMATAVCTLALFAGQVAAQLPCYGPCYQPKFPANAEKLKRQ